MKFLIVFFSLVLCSCSDTVQDYDGPTHRAYCISRCHEKYGTDLNFVGLFDGKCYCK